MATAFFGIRQAGYHQSLIRASNKQGRPQQLLRAPLLVGGDGGIRTRESRFCRPLPYHLATSPGLF